MFRSFSSKEEIHRKKKKKKKETMLPQQIAFMFSVIKPPADATIKRRIETFFEKDLHLKMEKADTDKDWSFLNKLADRGFLDAMKYHRKGVGDVIKLPFFDKWLIQYESAMNAFDMAELRDENMNLKEEIETLKKSNETYEDLLAGNKGLIEKNKKLNAELAEAHSEWKKEGESRLFENKKLKEELAEYKKNMRAVLNMIEYTIGGGSDVSMKINDILWFGDDDE
jgi:hypothetical protein